MQKKIQLFLIHFAGGNCYSFDSLRAHLPEFEVSCFELPGRGKRGKEKLLNEFDSAAIDIFKQVNNSLVSDNYLIYGHSMGAYLALRVTNMFERSGRPPFYLVVSGNAGPGIDYYKNRKKRYLMERQDFIEELKLLGGIPPELIENEEFFNYVEPILRADFEIAENNNLINEPATQTPLYAIMGSQEEKVDEISNWGRYTNSKFSYEVLEGDHFFIHRHCDRIAAIIKDCSKSISPTARLPIP
jgi:external thioesterase TEII